MLITHVCLLLIFSVLQIQCGDDLGNISNSNGTSSSMEEGKYSQSQYPYFVTFIYNAISHLQSHN